jgi:hypothetical protein
MRSDFDAVLWSVFRGTCQEEPTKTNGWALTEWSHMLSISFFVNSKGNIMKALTSLFVMLISDNRRQKVTTMSTVSIPFPRSRSSAHGFIVSAEV